MVIHVQARVLDMHLQYCIHCQLIGVLLDFSLTVKAATLIFISGCGSAISSAKEGNSGFIYNLLRVNKLFEPRKRACIS